MKPLKGNPTLRLLRLVLRRFNRLELLIQNNSRPLPDDLIDTPAVRMLTRCPTVPFPVVGATARSLMSSTAAKSITADRAFSKPSGMNPTPHQLIK